MRRLKLSRELVVKLLLEYYFSYVLTFYDNTNLLLLLHMQKGPFMKVIFSLQRQFCSRNRTFQNNN